MASFLLTLSYLLALVLSFAQAINFPFESTLLSPLSSENYSSIRPASQPPAPPVNPCRSIPSDTDWPTEDEWSKLNDTLVGALLKPVPLAAPCYNGASYNESVCAALQGNWGSEYLHAADPVSTHSQWAAGNTCVASLSPNATCSQGGYPVYVVEARTVRDVQIAVNFARNRNIRLVVKNSGHDFNGKNIGAHSLSVWTYRLRGLTYIPNYAAYVSNTTNTTLSSAKAAYAGRAVAVAGGTEAQDAITAQYRYNMTMLMPGGSTIGLAGGFAQGGGHSSHATYYGLVADNILSIQAVVPSGELVYADKDTNADLFWALRGGGGGTFGVVTSMVIKAFPQTPVADGSIIFSTLPSAFLNSTGISNDLFWRGVKEYLAYVPKIMDIGGFGFNYVQHTSLNGTSGLTFTVSIRLPNQSLVAYRAFVRPLLDTLNSLGISVPLPPTMDVKVHAVVPFQDKLPTDSSTAPASCGSACAGRRKRALGDIAGNTLIASRLFQQRNFASNASITEMTNAIREVVEDGGYVFHGQNYAPTLQVSGNPDNAVLPAFRTALMHSQVYSPDAYWDSNAPMLSPTELTAQHDRLQAYLQKWRDITPGSGSYLNEGDAQDTNWKDSHFGFNYDRLTEVKSKWDPWGVLWAVGGVGSDEWEVRNDDGTVRQGIIRQDGRLCRIGEGSS